MELWDQLKGFFQHQFLDVELWRIVVALAIIIVSFALKRLLIGAMVKGLLHLTKKTKTELDDKLVEAIRPPLGGITILAGLFFASLVIQFPSKPINVAGFVDGLLRTTGILIVAWALYRSIQVAVYMIEKVTAKTESELDDQLVPFVEKFLKVVVVVLGFVMVVREWGYDINGLLAGLGLGGLAFALAAKDTLANLFGSIMIITDRPFTLGDWVKTAQVEGTVEEIGFRSTKVRTFANSLVSVPNSIIANTTVENWSRMFKRRIYFKLGVTYSSSVAQIQETVERIKDILREHPDIRQDFWIVNFSDFNASSLDIMVYCFTQTTAWAEFLVVQEDVKLKIMNKIEEIGVDMAFPSHSVYMEDPDPMELKRLDEKALAMLRSRQEIDDPNGATTARGSGAGADG